MNAKNKVLLYGLIIGVLGYIIEALISYSLFSVDRTFLQILITAVPLNELYSRVLLFAAVMILAFIMTGVINDMSFEVDFLKRRTSAGKEAKPEISFISSLSYQIRTPLNAIVGFSELLKDPNLSIQSKQTYINHIHSSGNYLLQLISNLSDIARIETGQLAVRKEETALNLLLEELFRHFEEQKKEMGRADIALVLKKSVKDEHFSILTDKDRLRQIMSNLIENAIKQTEEGMVEFGYRMTDDQTLELFVKDTGTGYSKERLEVLLSRNEKLTGHENHPFDSAALILMITRNLVKLLGGDFRAESKSGQGATFSFILPFKEVEYHGEPRQQGAGTMRPRDREWSGKTVLIAEDVESNFIYLQELLRPTGLKLQWAKNGQEAVDLVKKIKTIDLVLMDILMPEMDGYEATRIIKSLRPQLPVIAQTAYSLESERDKAEAVNFDDYLIKPIWSPQLMSAMEKFLR